MSLSYRSVLNGTLTVSGIITLVSGLFLFFRIKSYVIVVGHEYGSLLFSAACLLHLAIHWKTLLHSLRVRLPGWAMLLVLVLTTAGMAYTGVTTDASSHAMNRGGHAPRLSIR